MADRAALRKEHHNRLERQRRDDIKNRFNELRKVLPEDAIGSKASRAKILTAVADYIVEMEARNKKMEAKKVQLQKELCEVRDTVAAHEAMKERERLQMVQQQSEPSPPSQAESQ